MLFYTYVTDNKINEDRVLDNIVQYYDCLKVEKKLNCIILNRVFLSFKSIKTFTILISHYPNCKI